MPLRSPSFLSKCLSLITIAPVLFVPVQALSMTSNLLHRVRVELFFKSKSELKDRVKFLGDNGVTAFNLVNKDKKDAMEDWCAVIAEQSPDSSVSSHWSVKYNKVADRNGGDDATYERFSSFVNSIAGDEVLLISGSGEKKSMDSVAALKRLKQDRSIQPPPDDAAKICVAYNPFFPNEYDRDVENDRLLKKLESGQVNKVYFQFGTDMSLLQGGLDFICKTKEEKGLDELEICGSIFLPTKKLIAQQKFRPWNGVYLSNDFLSGEAGARNIVLDMIRMYRQYDAGLLFEAPGIRNEKDYAVMTGLLEDSTGATDNSEAQTKKAGRSRGRGSSETSSDEPPSKSKKARKTKAKEANEPKAKQKPEDVKSTIDDRKLQPSPLVDAAKLSSPCIVLFGSHDVRLHDNRCVEYGSFHSTVIPAFLWNEQGQWGVNGAMQVILKAALTSLDERLKDNGMQLICRSTSADESTNELLQLCKETGALVVYCNIEHTPEDSARLEQRSEVLSKHGIQLVKCNSSLLYNPAELNLGTGFNGGHFATLMPFLKACKKQFGHPIKPLTREESSSMLAKMKGPRNWPGGSKIEDLPLAKIKGRDRWDKPILDRFHMNEDSAKNLLDQFMVGGLTRYESERSRADLEGSTSQLSAHLRVGTLSPYELYWATEQSDLLYDEKKTFSRRLFWRDLAYFQLKHFPFMREKSIRQHYEDTKWVEEEEEARRFEAWKKGRTGYPLVDAGMRELWATGWMTQSVRMVCASFLVEYLRVNWTRGAEWFHYTLVDADSAINPMMWQNAGRSGIDQWNFVMSPENGSQDVSGQYVAKWVPEIALLPKSKAHKPWKASEDELLKAGVVLGDNYPHRIVTDLKAEREKSVEVVLDMRRQHQQWNDDNGYDIIQLPSGDKTKVFTKKEYRIDRFGLVMEIEKSSREKAKARSGGRGRSGRKDGAKKSKKSRRKADE